MPGPISQAPPEIRLTALSKHFGPKVVLDGLDLAIAKGESIVILGKSGTGKSVLLKHMIGLLTPDAGVVEVEGEDLWNASRSRRDEIRRRFGMSFQEGALFDSMSVGENIAFPLKRHTKMTPDEVRGRVAECLSLVKLHGIEGKRPSELSGGMRRRVGFARAIALKPEVLLFDEPTTGLDPITTDVLARVMIDLRDRMNPTMVTITHDLKVAFEVAERVALLDRGKILVDLPPREFEASDDPRVRAFVRGDGSEDAESGAPEEATA
ncbi:MAG TPA: ATP-binding cassette domain-containing protein [Thermoanaerobaculia bacterium]|nr:ATP-binding cassette domain-containing protein [Thermoanaerobaculia bacterium]